jgi:pilus assembly protein Flp/PilA
MAPLTAAAVSAQGVGMPRFWQDEQGQGLVEYALILAVISIAILVALVFFKDQLSNLFSSIGNNLT